MNRLSSKLAARTSVRQLDLLHAANAAGYAADALVRERWAWLTNLLVHPQARLIPPHVLAAHLRAMWYQLHTHLRDSLTGFARDGHDSAAAVLVDVLPQRALLQARPGRPNAPVPVFTEARQTRVPARVPGAARKTQQSGLFIGQPPRRPREPVLGASDDDRRRQDLKDILFPAPSAAKVADILKRPVFGQTWEQDLSTASKLAGFNPDLMAATISRGFAAGNTPQQIAKQLLPAVEGVKKSARRIARTYGMQVSHAVSREAHEQLGDLLVGYQIHAQLDQNTRSWHAARSGTSYYKNPVGEQKGYYQMPSPPLEAEDPNERPPGEPRLSQH